MLRNGKLRRIVALIAAVMVVIAMSATVFAATPYKDVKKSKVGETNYKGICWGKKIGIFGPFKIKKGKFKPFKVVTKGQFLGVLKKTYPKVPKSFFTYKGDKSKPLTVGFMKSWLTKLAKNAYGIDVRWEKDKNPKSMKLQRYLFCGYLYNFEKFFELRECDPII